MMSHIRNAEEYLEDDSTGLSLQECFKYGLHNTNTTFSEYKELGYYYIVPEQHNELLPFIPATYYWVDE